MADLPTYDYDSEENENTSDSDVTLNEENAENIKNFINSMM